MVADSHGGGMGITHINLFHFEGVCVQKRNRQVYVTRHASVTVWPVFPPRFFEGRFVTFFRLISWTVWALTSEAGAKTLQTMPI